MRYVKLCPRCGQANEELAEICAKDGEFLGMVPATPAPVEPVAAAAGASASAAGASASAASPQETAPQPRADGEPVQPVLYLDAATGELCLPVRPNWVVGQAHADSTAEVQLPQLPGVSYVHRRHCQFEFVQNQWHVLPIAQPDYTNPTLVNDRRVSPGDRAVLRNGDRLALSGIRFTIRILES